MRPEHPTGALLAPAEWERLLAALPPGCVVAADEACLDYVPFERRIPRLRDVEARRPVVLLRSFSKFYGPAGLRLGYVVADEALVAYLAAVEERYNVNCVVLAEGLARRRLLVRAGSELGLPGYLRITVAPAPVMRRVVDDFREVVAELAPVGT